MTVRPPPKPTPKRRSSTTGPEPRTDDCTWLDPMTAGVPVGAAGDAAGADAVGLAGVDPALCDTNREWTNPSAPDAVRTRSHEPLTANTVNPSPFVTVATTEPSVAARSRMVVRSAVTVAIPCAHAAVVTNTMAPTRPSSVWAPARARPVRMRRRTDSSAVTSVERGDQPMDRPGRHLRHQDDAAPTRQVGDRSRRQWPPDATGHRGIDVDLRRRQRSAPQADALPGRSLAWPSESPGTTFSDHRITFTIIHNTSAPRTLHAMVRIQLDFTRR